MKILDVFSGIGGMTLALDCFEGFETTQFCDIDPRSQAVLRHRMQHPCHGTQLPNVPIQSDIRDVHCDRHEYDIIVAGFPCTGFSSVGYHQGVENEGSGLVTELTRLVRECEPKMVLLENVPAIVKYPEFPSICRNICDLGYKLVWTTMRASDLGAPHGRRRWWGLAIRTDISSGQLQIRLKPGTQRMYDWSEEPVDRCVPKSAITKDRLFVLGNTLVPCVARMAFLALFTGMNEPFSALVNRTEWVYAEPTIRQPQPTFSHHGMYTQQGIQYIHSPVNDLNLYRPRGYVMDPTLYSRNDRVPKNTLPRFTEPKHTDFLPTPRTIVFASNVLTARSKNDLPTVLRFERHTTGPRDGAPNPSFVDWMMGYPVGWTDTNVQYSR